MNDELFTAHVVSSDRILYTASSFARLSLLHLQEIGSLTANRPHTSKREKLQSYLCFVVEDGNGTLEYEGKTNELVAGDVVFIDCRKPYSHSTSKKLWNLRWCHFYGPNMSSIYRKYMERGGQPVFQTQQLSSYHTILSELYSIANSDDYVRDMRIHEKLSSLLILLMEDAWTCRDKNEEVSEEPANKSVDIQEVKEYLDSSFKQKLTIDDLAGRFYINKYYLMSLFKGRYGVTVNAYLNQLRVTYVKQNLRFTEKTVEMLAMELDIEPTYLSRLFKKIEGISPSEYRKQWSSNRDKDKT